MASGQGVPTTQQQQQSAQQGQGQGQVPGSQQQQQMKAQLKSMKLAPSSKPQGIDPSVERESIGMFWCCSIVLSLAELAVD
jgi:hypothetical protein